MATPSKIKPKLDITAKFSGAPGECPEAFIKQFHLIATVAAWSQPEIIQYLPLYLAGTALSWWSTMQNPVDWANVKSLMIKTFSSPLDRVPRTQTPCQEI